MISRRVFLQAAAVTGAGLALGAGAAKPGGWRVTKCRAEENPTGIQFGFWNNYRRGAEAVGVFGRRPIAREGFTQWQHVEKQPGVYEWGKNFDGYQMLHRCGASVVVALNVIFTKEVNPQGSVSIPSFYPQRISNPTTRAAARKFVYAYVQELLRRLGRVALCFDYELHWFYLPKTDAIRKEYRDWFVEACALARKAAADLGKADCLRLIPISNGNPVEFAEKLLGGAPAPQHKAQPWMLDVANAGDLFGMDTYAFDLAAPTSPKTTLQAIQFWKDHYAGTKPIYVTENGFSSVKQAEPSYARKRGSHAFGTEAQQRDYFANLLDELAKANRPGGPLDNRVRAYCIWMFRDMKSDNKPDPLEHYFGMLRLDGSLKPAAEAVRERWRKLEADPVTAPHRVVAREEVTSPLSGQGAPVALTYGSGVEFESLRCEQGNLPARARYTLRVETVEKGDVVVCVNGEHWLTTAGQDQTNYALDVTKLVKAGGANSFELWFTSAVFPFAQKVRRVALE